MKAIIEATREGVGDHTPSTDLICPRCGNQFQPKRSNQQYCDPACQKAASRNTSRGPRTTACSPTRRVEKRRQWATLAYLNETFYGTPPGQRLGLLKDWLDMARMGDTRLRAVLTRPDFCKWGENKRACFRRSYAYPPIPYLAHRFCQRFRACAGSDWVHGRADEPETGEMMERQAITD